MPIIMPIKDLRNTNKISDMAHKIDQAIYESEKELEEGSVQSLKRQLCTR